MSDIIQLLPDSVANQIAAGEVIQRPASVVKELVENSIDAHSTYIQVHITDAGRSRIQVIDDGTGMSDTDARLAFERHATSKIRQATDLYSLHTMGFRGEALPSIAAVAQVDIKTRRHDASTGTHIAIEASKVKSQQPAACAKGTSITVENIFFNLPARRRFLKSNTTELNNIIQTFERIALVYPTISFLLTHNTTEVYNLAATNLKQRILDISGRKNAQQLLPLEAETPLCKVHGYIGKPESARKRGVPQYFFTNGRYMRHPYFHKAVTSVYERLVPQGEHTPYYIYIDIDPQSIDVNIHPTKTEIKFEYEQAMWQMLTSCIRSAIGRYDQTAMLDFDTEGRPDIPVFDQSAGTASAAKAPHVDFNEAYRPAAVPAHWDMLYPPPAEKGLDVQLFDEQPQAEDGPQPGLAAPASLHYQYKGRYIVTAVKSGLMLIDIHRANLRILYEEFARRDTSSTAPTQQLVFPETIQLTPSRDAAFSSLLPLLSTMGFDIQKLGKYSYAVYGIPDILATQPIAELIDGMLASVESDIPEPTLELRQHIALQLALRTAMKADTALTQQEIDNIVNRLFQCEDPGRTPDGKPILHIIPREEIDKYFDS